MGKPVKCRVKSVLQSSTYQNAGNQQMGMPPSYGGMDPYAYAGFNQGFYGMPPSPNFFGGMPPHPQVSPQMAPFGGKQPRGNSKQTPADGEDVYYKGQFVLVERTSFDAVVKQ